ncbi:alpha/beta fold hydrolase [Saccharicrinis sp. FJH54]|uniref:alpha/beta fold hydrolase n=1 Tax=Saccharicrinis sp. FJH54 TaxID=3344665 RepID=UPI0035D51359
MEQFIFDSKTITYRSQGDGELIIFLPGNTASSIVYQPQIDFFSKYYLAVSVDFLGTGKSDRISDIKENWWRFSATQINALIEHLGYNKAIIVGSSGGSIVAMFLAADFPEKVSHLILDSFSVEFTAEMLENNVIRERSNPNDAQKQFWTYCHGNDWESIIKLDTENIKRIVENGGYWLEDAPQRVKCPVLLSGSREDSFIPNIEQDFKRLTSQISDCRFVLSDKGGHPLIWTNTAFFNAEVLNFLNATGRN